MSVTVPCVVVTNCTTRKAAGKPVVLGRVRATDDIEVIARHWREVLERADHLCKAGELYKGRSIVDATASAARVNGSLYIVSAGLGLVSAEQSVPNYDLTVTAGSALAIELQRRGLDAQDWWSVLARSGPRPLSLLLDRTAAYVALPATYVRLVRSDLAQMSRAGRSRLRIFTSTAGRRELPGQLAMYAMPYDDRLESIAGYDGTRAEFPQRALRHFVEVLRGHEMSLEDGAEAVRRCLASRGLRTIPTRRRVSDDEVRALLRKHWDECNGSSTRLLRHLRDRAHVSCEQGRFRTLWLQLAGKAAS